MADGAVATEIKKPDVVVSEPPVEDRIIEPPTERSDPVEDYQHATPDTQEQDRVDALDVEPTPLDGAPDGQMPSLEDIRAQVAEMRARAGMETGEPQASTENAEPYVPEKPDGKIRQFLKRHRFLTPIMATIAGLSAIAGLLARFAAKSTKERQGQ